MFEVIADEILYDRRTVARFLPNVQPTLRDRAEADLEFDAKAVDKSWCAEIMRLIENEEALETLAEEHKEQLDDAKFERDEARQQRDEYVEIMRLIENEEGMTEQLLRARAEAEDWRRKYLEAIQPKGKKRR